MKYWMVALALLCTSGCFAAEAPLLPARVNDSIRARVAAGEYPAIVIGVVDGKRSEIYSFGKLDNGRPPDANTLFEIGSVTKTFTALLLSQAVLQGELKLDEPVATLLPGFSLPSRHGKAITLEGLATHHSGLPREPTNLDTEKSDPEDDYAAETLKSFLGSYALPRDPGTSYEYSNLAVGLLGYALGQHAGTGYAKLLHQQIFGPLDMHGSMIASDVAGTRARIGHDAFGNTVEDLHLGVLAADGGIVSNAADMLKYLKANMGLQPSALYPAMQFAQLPRVEGSGPGERVGLVWMTRHDPNDDVIWHGGSTSGYQAFLGFNADRQRGVVILTNVSRPVDGVGFAVLSPNAPLPPVHKYVKLSTQTMDSYVGSYRVEPHLILNILRVNDQLFGRATDQNVFPFFAGAGDELFADGSNIRISFTRDAQGQVRSLVLHQHGDRIAPRLTQAELDATHGNKLVMLDSATLKDYIGRYQLAPDVTAELSLRVGQLMVSLTGQSAFPVYANARDKFFFRVVDAKIDFERGSDGKVIALVLHQDGVDQRGKRLTE